MANTRQLQFFKRCITNDKIDDWNSWLQSKLGRWMKSGQANLVLGRGVVYKRIVDLSGADLRGLGAEGIHLHIVDLSGAHLENASFPRAIFDNANLRGAHLERAFLAAADFTEADLQDAKLNGAILQQAILLRTNLTGANLSGCNVYGASVWDVKLKNAIQHELIFTSRFGPALTVDNLEVAQFIYLLLENQKLHDIIDTITSKVVLILGRFSEPHKRVLDMLREELRKYDLTPVVFDFAKPKSRSLTATVTTLAHMAKFIIADLTDARSIPQELTEITHAVPTVPIQPILLTSVKEWSMFNDLKNRGLVLDILTYRDVDDVRTNIVGQVVERTRRLTEAWKQTSSGTAGYLNEIMKLQSALEMKDRQIEEMQKRPADRKHKASARKR
jgi:uncharacterized protein YjbI with pentapeptide repeats